MRAYIEQLLNDHTYAFVQTNDRRVFMHKNDCDFDLADCQVGDVVEVDVEETTRGPRVVWAQWIERPDPDVVEGEVNSVVAHKGIAFMIPDGAARNQQVMLHLRAFTDYDKQSDTSKAFSALSRGARVRCTRRPSDKGARGFHVQVV